MKPSVLITGASSGIGAATAKRLVSGGFEVFGTSRNPVAAGANADGLNWIEMDVRSEESVRAGFGRALAKVDQLDAVVCNAGYGVFGSVEELSVAAASEQFDTNFFGTLRTLRAAIPTLREARAGRIVLVSSLAAQAPIPFQAHYSASKSAINALGLALHSELRPFGVHVSLVEPGDISTGFNDATDFGDQRQSPYGDRILRCAEVIRETLIEAPDPDTVARTVERALTSRRPRVRYAVGPDSLGVPFGRRFLPDWLFLRFIRARYGV
jgi:NAD(P)-dependent dehydrogenase (short-subunit alcohol dehydrogenase family)